MNEEEKDSIEILKNTDLDINTIYSIDLRTYNYAVKTVLNLLEKKDIDIIEAKEANRQLSIELQKKDKIIDEMAKDIIKYETELGYEGNYKNKEEVIKYFEERCK